LTSREAKGRMNGHRNRRCQKTARDSRMKTIGNRAEYVEEKWRRLGPKIGVML